VLLQGAKQAWAWTGFQICLQCLALPGYLQAAARWGWYEGMAQIEALHPRWRWMMMMMMMR